MTAALLKSFFIAMYFGHLPFLIMTVLISITVGDLVFVQTGSSVQLDIQLEKIPKFNSLFWSNDKAENIVIFAQKPKVYKDRVHFNEKTSSLTLRNMQKSDSGIYTATASGDKEVTVAEYNVSVIDPVETPVLNVSKDNSCNINVTCSANDLTLSSSYHGDNCSQEEVTSSEIHNLTLHCKEDVVVCNYSNPVSWKNGTIQIKQLCTTHENVIQEKNPENSSFLSLQWLLVIAFSVAVVFLAGSSVLYCSYTKCKKGAEQSDQTIYAEVQANNEVHRAMEMSEYPHTVYSAESINVQGQRRKSKREYHVYNDVPERTSAKTQRGNNHLQTIYHTVGQHQKPSVPKENDRCIYSMVSKSTN